MFFECILMVRWLCFFFSAVAPSLSGIPICHSERKQRRGLPQEEFPWDARVHEKIQCPGNTRWHTWAQVRQSYTYRTVHIQYIMQTLNIRGSRRWSWYTAICPLIFSKLSNQSSRPFIIPWKWTFHIWKKKLHLWKRRECELCFQEKSVILHHKPACLHSDLTLLLTLPLLSS